MKTIWKKTLVLPLLLAVTAGPLFAEPIDSGNVATNPTTLAPPSSPVPPSPPVLPAPPQNPTVMQHRVNIDPENVPVSIGPGGIHIGGPSPVDISGPNFNGSSVKLFALMLPIVITAIVFLFLAFVVGYFLYIRHRRYRLLHETIRTMIDKGVPIPSELLGTPERKVARQASDLRSALAMIGAGVGLLLLFRGAVPVFARFGWIPVGIGVAFLVTWFIERKNKDKNGGPTA